MSDEPRIRPGYKKVVTPEGWAIIPDDSPPASRLLRRGKGPANPIPLTKLTLRLVYPPFLTNSITERPAANLPYELDVGGKTPLSGTTDGNGMLHCELPTTVQSGLLVIHSPSKDAKQPFWKLRIIFKDLDSSHETGAGEYARLSNLGLLADADTCPDTEHWIRARMRFVALFGVPDGQLIEDRIKAVYGS